jgi:stress-induced-phosphoprotein 1
MSKHPQAIAKKTEGNNAFKAKNYEEAIQKYTEAISFDGSDVTFFSNRSACYAAKNMWQQAFEDGRQCVIVDKSFVKGYFRAALACQNLDNLKDANEFITRGLGIESTNADLKKMQKEIEDLQRKQKIDSVLEQAQKELSNNDAAAAFKTLEVGLRIDPNNPALSKMMDQVRPRYERLEKERVANLDPRERIKEQADKEYKDAKFEQAIKTYTKCIDQISDKSSELAIKCYNNRAACHKQLSNFDATIEDSTAVLEHRPDDVKALIRRAQAYEACERFKSALQDTRAVLAMDANVIGKATLDLANGMQNRLNRVIAQLKNG